MISSSKLNSKIVICDTNIWYKPDLIKEFRTKFPDYKLYATYLNIFEIALSPNVLRNRSNTNLAVKTLSEEHDSIIDIHPFLLFLNPNDQEIVFPHFENQACKIKYIFESLKMGLKPNKDKFDLIINERNKTLTSGSTYFNEKLPQYRPIVKSLIKENSRKYWESVTVDTKRSTYNLLNALINGGVKAFSNNSKEYLLELTEEDVVFKIMDRYYRELLAQQNSKMHNNDWIDLINFAYLKHGDYYFTGERKWNAIAEKENLSSVMIQL